MKFVNYIYISILITIISLVTFSKASNSSTYTATSKKMTTISHSKLKANSKAKLDKRNFKVYKLSTKLKDSKMGSILSLKNHEVECPSTNVLTGFHLWGKKGYFSNDISFEYNCSPNKAIQKIEIKQKSKKVKIGNSKNSLDKLANIEVKCLNGYLLKEFELEDSSNKIYWKYKCIQTYSEKCEEKFTDYRNARYGKIFFKSISGLSAHKIQVDKGYGLQGFKGQNQGSKFRVVYTQCKFSDVGKTPNQPKEKKSFIKRFIKKAKDIKKAIKNYFKRITIYKVDNSKPTVHTKEEDMKINKFGHQYCYKFCKAVESRPKKCHEGKTKRCYGCVLKKVPDTVTKFKQNELCNDICSQTPNSSFCKFFPFKMTIKRKMIKIANLKTAAGI